MSNQVKEDPFYFIDLDDCGGRVAKYLDGQKQSEYRVDLPESCNCPSRTFRGKPCKHIEMIQVHSHPRLLTKSEAREITKRVIVGLKNKDDIKAVEVADFKEKDGMIECVTLDVCFDLEGTSFPVLAIREGLQFKVHILYLR